MPTIDGIRMREVFWENCPNCDAEIEVALQSGTGGNVPNAARRAKENRAVDSITLGW